MKVTLSELSNIIAESVKSVLLKSETAYMPYIKYIQNSLTPQTLKILEYAQIERLVSDEELCNFFSEKGSAEDYEGDYMLYICPENSTVELGDCKNVRTIGSAECDLHSLKSIAEAAVVCLNKFGEMVPTKDI